MSAYVSAYSALTLCNRRSNSIPTGTTFRHAFWRRMLPLKDNFFDSLINRNCNDCQLSILQCTDKSSGVYGMDRDDTIENYHDFSVIFAIELMELLSK